MPFTERDADRYIADLKVGEVVYTNGPIIFGGARLWEVWTFVREDKEYETRFIPEREGHDPIYFDTFVVLAAHLNELFNAASREGSAIDWTRTKEKADIQLKMMTLIVASIVFLMTVGTMLYLH
jgi:hypothetical protein